MLLRASEWPSLKEITAVPRCRLGSTAFVSRESAGLNDRRVHASRFPPETAAPLGRAAVGFLVADDQVIRRSQDTAAFEIFIRVELDAADGQIFGAIGMAAEEPAVVTVTHKMTVELPGPGRAVVEPFALNGRVVEQVALAGGAITDDGNAPPVGPGRGFIGRREILVAVRGESVLVLVRIELHEQSDLAEIVQARNALAFGFSAGQSGEQHAGRGSR